MSSESKPCVICGRKTSTYQTYEQSSIQITIPLCETESRHCYGMVDVAKFASKQLTELKRAVHQSATANV